jgi:hypothetical protein
MNAINFFLDDRRLRRLEDFGLRVFGGYFLGVTKRERTGQIEEDISRCDVYICY